MLSGRVVKSSERSCRCRRSPFNNFPFSLRVRRPSVFFAHCSTVETTTKADLAVSLVAHEDWLVHVLLNDGRVYVFQTEMWGTHYPPALDEKSREENTHWPRTLKQARLRAIACGCADTDPFAAEVDPSLVTTPEQLLEVCSRACERMSDRDFRRLIL